jgi:hypothetical protein
MWHAHIDKVTPRDVHGPVHEVALLHKQRAHLSVDCPAMNTVSAHVSDG